MTIENELTALTDEAGLIRPHAVVEWARDNPDSELHKHREFYWSDDAKAAEEHRLTVARTLIRVHVRTEEGERGTISLLQDRRSGGGYRRIEPVMSNTELRAMALRQALRELHAWERRYKHMQELAAVFEARAAIAKTTAPAEAA